MTFTSTPEKNKLVPLKQSLIKVSVTPFIILIVLSTVFIGQIFRLISMSQWINHSDQVIAKIYENEKLTLDLETGVRAYIITFDKSFLDPYEKSRSQIMSKFHELEELLSNRPEQKKTLTILKENTQKLTVISIKLLSKSTQKLKRDQVAINELISEQKAIMDSSRHEFSLLIQETKKIREVRSEKTNQAVLWMVAVCLLLTLSLGSILAFTQWKKINAIAEIYEEALNFAQNAQNELKTVHKELERKVIKRTFALTLANQELEAFSYSVSHDLRAPLRGIDGFSQALLEDYGDQLDDTAKKYLNHIRTGTQKMGKLIDDMLNLARLSRIEMIPQEVNLSQLANTVASQLQESNPERKVSFKISESLIAKGDPGLLNIVIENLFSNAWKFSEHCPDTTIEFGKTNQRGRLAYFVKDNGVGFNMAYSHKLFGTFQRLHSAQDFQGNGVGLATTRRIIIRHGGEIWADSKVNEGATFFFTL